VNKISKSKANLTFDSTVWERFKREYNSASQVLENFMRNKLEIDNSELSERISEVEKEIEEKENKIKEHKNNLKSLEKELNRLKQRKEEQEDQKLTFDVS